jgi:CheY-like chemotaxis protein
MLPARLQRLKDRLDVRISGKPQRLDSYFVAPKMLCKSRSDNLMLSLVVDDDPLVRTFVTSILHRQHFETLEADGGNRAFQIVQSLSGQIDLIISDIRMPEGDGLTFAEAVKKAFPSVPIILVSGDTKPDSTFVFIEKPFASTTLAAAVNRLVPPIGNLG